MPYVPAFIIDAENKRKQKRDQPAQMPSDDRVSADQFPVEELIRRRPAPPRKSNDRRYDF